MGQYGATRLRLLLFNLATDEDDPVLGFTSAWIRALAARCASVDVITMRAGRLDLPANVRVRSVGKEKGHSIPRRIGAFYRLLFEALREGGVDGCFSHMMPAFSALGGPVLRARRIPLVTWYAHPSLTRTLRVAHRLSDRMVASLPTAYPYRKDKLTVVGQGIDTTVFSPGGAEDEPPLLLSVGRLSAVKDHPTLIDAAARLQAEGERFRLALVGGPVTPKDDGYVRDLRAQVEARGLGPRVDWVGPVPSGRPLRLVSALRRPRQPHAHRLGRQERARSHELRPAKPGGQRRLPRHAGRARGPAVVPARRRGRAGAAPGERVASHHGRARARRSRAAPAGGGRPCARSSGRAAARGVEGGDGAEGRRPPVSAPQRLRVLSLGFTRELWEPAPEAGDDSRARLSEYSGYLAAYHVIVHSLRRHGLDSPRQVTPTLTAHATGGRGRLHSWRPHAHPRAAARA